MEACNMQMNVHIKTSWQILDIDSRTGSCEIKQKSNFSSTFIYSVTIAESLQNFVSIGLSLPQLL